LGIAEYKKLCTVDISTLKISALQSYIFTLPVGSAYKNALDPLKKFTKE